MSEDRLLAGKGVITINGIVRGGSQRKRRAESFKDLLGFIAFSGIQGHLEDVGTTSGLWGSLLAQVL